MSLAITAGSLPSLRPLYRVAARKFSWKTSFFSDKRSGLRASRAGITIGGSGVGDGWVSCDGESERKIIRGGKGSDEFVLEERRVGTAVEGKGEEGFMGITKATRVQVDYEDRGRV